MSDLRPLGSERLQGDEKIRRILEIARYKEVPKQVVNEVSSVEYSKTLSDGVKYVIAKEKLGYIIKKSINEGVEEYIEPMKNRRYYNSYSQALKRLNLLAREVNYTQGVNEETSLFGEQKKFVLKTPKPSTPEPTYDEPSADLGMDAGLEAQTDLEMSAEPSMDAGTDTGSELDFDMGMDAGGEETPDMGMETPSGEGETDFKTIQKITGKLSQKLRELDSTQGLDSSNMKYVINSILSAMDLEKFKEEDKEEVIERLEGEIDYGLDDTSVDVTADTEGGEDVDIDIDSTEETTEPELGEGIARYYGNDEFGWHGSGGEMYGPDDMDFDYEDERDFDFETLGKFAPHLMDKESVRLGDPSIKNLRLRYKNRPKEEKSDLDRIMDSIFAESKVEKTINKYLNESVIKETKIKNENKKKLMIESVNKMATTYEQEVASKRIIKEFKEVELIGRTNKKNIVVKINGEEFKINQKGLLE